MCRWVLADPMPAGAHVAPPVPLLPTFLPLKHLGLDVRAIQGTNPAVLVFVPADRMVSASSVTEELVLVLPRLHRVSRSLPTRRHLWDPHAALLSCLLGAVQGCSVPSPRHVEQHRASWSWSQVLLKHSSPQLWYPHQQCWA